MTMSLSYGRRSCKNSKIISWGDIQLILHKYRPNALTTTPQSPKTKVCDSFLDCCTPFMEAKLKFSNSERGLVALKVKADCFHLSLYHIKWKKMHIRKYTKVVRSL